MELRWFIDQWTKYDEYGAAILITEAPVLQYRVSGPAACLANGYKQFWSDWQDVETVYGEA